VASGGSGTNWRRRIEPLARPFIHAWWRISRGLTLGVRGIVQRADGRVVLVRHTYVPGWHLPGGGVEAGEPVLTALRRELAEEAGIAMTGPAVPLGVYSNHRLFRGDHVAVYVVRDWTECETDHDGEIEAVDWFDPSDLPEDTSPATRRRLLEWADAIGPAEEW